MASLASSAHFTGSKFIINEPHQPTSVKFRSIRVSAPACASTAETTRPQQQHITSPGSLYEVLGIQIGATCPEIKAAYRKLARVLHPDVAANNSSQNENRGYEFMKLHEAYETLSDPEKRADYDRTLFRRRRPLSSSNSILCGYTRRTWETDQCW